LSEWLSQQLDAIQDQGDHEIATQDHERPLVDPLKMQKRKLPVRAATEGVVQSVEAEIPKK